MTSIRLKVFDDYSSDVDAIRQHAIHDTYYPPTINDWWLGFRSKMYSHKDDNVAVSYTHLRAHETREDLV